MQNSKSNFPKFTLLWTGEFISAIGSGLTSFGLGVYVFDQTGSAGSMVLVTLLAFLPTLLFSVPAGVLADRYVICLFGFAFFAALPVANNCLDYLVRTNIPDVLQGRAWGVIGFLSQIGYVAAYALAGIAADGIAAWFRIGVGRGGAWGVTASGLLLGLTAALLSMLKSVQKLEGPQCLKS